MQENNILVRPAAESDIEQLGDLGTTFGNEFAILLADGTEVDANETKAAFKRDLTRNEISILVAGIQEKLIGYISTQQDDDGIWVEEIFVLKQYRGTRAARLLWQVMEQEVKRIGVTTLNAYVYPGGKPHKIALLTGWQEINDEIGFMWINKQIS